VTNGIPYYEEAYSFDTLQNTFLAGEYTGSESDDVNEVDVSSDTEEETEEKEVVSAKQTYQAKYPEVYEWPADSNGTRYSRWNYVIDSDTTFTSTIIFKDGTQMVSGNQDEDDDTSIDFSSDDYSYGTADVDGDSSAMQILVTTAGTYYIDNESMSDVIINTASSTSSVTVLSYNGNKYYIETSNSSKIDTYKETCIYSTNDMSSLDYSINSEDTKAAVTELGRIVPYTITYTDFDDATQTKGYMAVYTIDNDYLVIYADNMDDSTDTMIELLKTLVTK
jgi:ribosomal protein S18